MAKVATLFKVSEGIKSLEISTPINFVVMDVGPKPPTAKMVEKVSRSVKETLQPKSMQLEDVAFGIKVLKVLFIHEDSDGSSALEEKLRKIKGVNEVEVEEESLL